MIENQEMQDLISIFNQHKHPSPQQTVREFLGQWQQFAEDQAKKIQQNYIWQLVHGQLNENNTQSTIQVQRYAQKNINTAWKTHWQDHIADKNIYLKVSNNSAIIRVEQYVYFINPNSEVSKFAAQLEEEKYMLYIVISNSNLNLVINLLKMLKECKFQRVITSQQIFRKMVTLDLFYTQNKISTYQNILRNHKIGLLKEGEYFQYGRLLWKITSCCWYEPVYDLEISNKKDIHLLLEAPKIYESKTIYTAWKKNLMSEQNYQKYIAQTEQRQQQSNEFIIFQVEEETLQTKIAKKYLNFIKKEVIRELDGEVQQDIWECCEELEYTKGQIIVKKGTQCDFVYALEQGEFQVNANNSLKSADKKIVYGLEDLKRRQLRYTFDLLSKSESVVQRIRVENMQFHLYLYLSKYK